MYFHNENKYTPQARIVQFPLIIYFGNLSNAFYEIALIFLSVDMLCCSIIVYHTWDRRLSTNRLLIAWLLWVVT